MANGTPTKAWRRETRAWQDERGRYWEEAGDWEQVRDAPQEWFDRVDPAVHKITMVVIFAACVYILAVMLSTAWCGV
jgi:hypothetical protein